MPEYFTKQSLILSIRKKSFENIVGEGENICHLGFSPL